MSDGQKLGDAEDRFAEKVKALRVKRGWTQKELAEALVRQGIDDATQVTVSRLEGKARAVRLGEARALAAVFEQPLSTMMSTGKLAEATEEAREAVQNARKARIRLEEAATNLLGTRNLTEYYIEVLERLLVDEPDAEVTEIARGLIVELDSVGAVEESDFTELYERAQRRQDDAHQFLLDMVNVENLPANGEHQKEA